MHCNELVNLLFMNRIEQLNILCSWSWVDELTPIKPYPQTNKSLILHQFKIPSFLVTFNLEFLAPNLSQELDGPVSRSGCESLLHDSTPHLYFWWFCFFVFVFGEHKTRLTGSCTNGCVLKASFKILSDTQPALLFVFYSYLYWYLNLGQKSKH